MAYQGNPRAFAAQSMLQPLQRHTPTKAPNTFMDVLGDVAIKGCLVSTFDASDASLRL